MDLKQALKLVMTETQMTPMGAKETVPQLKPAGSALEVRQALKTHALIVLLATIKMIQLLQQHELLDVEMV